MGQLALPDAAHVISAERTDYSKYIIETREQIL